MPHSGQSLSAAASIADKEEMSIYEAVKPFFTYLP